MTLWGAALTAAFQSAAAGQRLMRNAKESKAEYAFTFSVDRGGAPALFRSEKDVLAFVQRIAPHAEIGSRFRSGSSAFICFPHHPMGSISPDNIDEIIQRRL